jgi:hypothetical protein
MRKHHVAAVFFASLIAAFYARRTAPNGLSMRGGSLRTLPMPRWIVAAQLALSVVVLVVAGLLFQTARAYRNVNPGFEYARQLRVPVDSVPLPRLRELAIRAAHGATPLVLARMIAASSGRLLAFGACAGALIAIPAARSLVSLLYGVTAFDRLTWLGVIAVIATTVAVATALPARRAMAVNPSELLRESS